MPSGKYSPPVQFNWGEYHKGQRNGAWLGKPDCGMRILFKGVEAAWDSPIEMPSLPPVSFDRLSN